MSATAPECGLPARASAAPPFVAIDGRPLGCASMARLPDRLTITRHARVTDHGFLPQLVKTASSLRSMAAILACAALFAGGLQAAGTSSPASDKPALPRLVDLGAGRCIPCRQMKPILDELKRDYATRFETVFIDVWENRDEGRRYGIQLIPTQIFYDASGKELFRHEGFMAKKDILAKWRELGLVLDSPATPAGS